MAKPRGLPKTGGRTKGTPNKRTALLSETLEQLGLDVPKALVKCLDKKYRGTRVHVIGAYDRAQILLQLMNYLYPRRKAIEHDIKAGGPLEAYLRMTPEERATRREELEKRLGKG